MKQTLFKQTKSANRKRSAQKDPGVLSRIFGFFLVLSATFPISALLSYDYTDIKLLHAGPGEVHNLMGIIGAYSTFFGYIFFGFALWFIPVWMVVFGIFLMSGKLRNPWRSLAWALLFQFCLGAIFEIAGNQQLVEKLNIRSAGGAVSWFFMTKCFVPYVGKVGSLQIIIGLMILALLFGVGLDNWRVLYRFICDKIEAVKIARASGAEKQLREQRQREMIEAREKRDRDREERRLEKEEQKRVREEERERKRQERLEKEREREAAREQERLEYEEQKARLIREREAAETARRAEAERIAAEAAKAGENEIAVGNDEAEPDRHRETRTADSPFDSDEDSHEFEEKPYVLPSVDLLSVPPQGDADPGDTEKTAELIAATLTEFKVPGTITHIEEGPVITTYEFQPAPRIRPEQVAAMDRTLEMRIMAKSLRIEAPIPGKGVCGIEVPNKTARAVTVREILNGDLWKAMSKRLRLPLLLGKDASGHDLIVDLADMPHLLVAGATGSGKSVCMNAILTGLLMSRTPDELKLILVDPKVVEFTGYNAIPHLVVPVITEPKKVALGLIWAIHEMEKRYKMLSAVGVKNIESYNNRQRLAMQQETFDFGDEVSAKSPKSQYPEKLPYIVIVIDEMADLMLQVKKEVEDGITRLAQKSRAVGIHLILATQRPTVNIVTGTIKANVAGRIAFQVAQKNDSKVILDRMGADTLIGKGDMLFLNPRTGKTVRAQGAFITDEDAESVTEYIRSQAKPKYSQEAQEQLAAAGVEQNGASSKNETGAVSGSCSGESADDGTDELYEQAIAVIKRTRRASTSSLQRALAIGYNRAARIFDQLEERGIVGPSRGALPREILIDLDGEIPTNSDTSDSETVDFTVEYDEQREGSDSYDGGI